MIMKIASKKVRTLFSADNMERAYSLSRPYVPAQRMRIVKTDAMAHAKGAGAGGAGISAWIEAREVWWQGLNRTGKITL